MLAGWALLGTQGCRSTQISGYPEVPSGPFTRAVSGDREHWIPKLAVSHSDYRKRKTVHICACHAQVSCCCCGEAVCA